MNQNKTTPILLTIIAVLFVSILVLLAVYLPKNQSTPVKIDVALAPTIKPIVVAQITTTTPTPTSSIPNDWKTYNEKSLNLTFQYPSSWFISKSPGSQLALTLTPDPSDERGYVPIQISVDTATDANGYIHSDTIQEAQKYYLAPSLKSSNTVIAGLQSINIAGIYTNPGLGNGTYIQYTLIQLKDKVLVVQLGKKDFLNEYNQILSTFKFTQ